ncbi:Hpt domain-containing protein, partial [Solidesulfovibrio sp.]|uniref:Hpt domain-containing protein n=1 Tax=Solidesulfovibrio sp. TaxID=2910990 RepID=UPI00261918EC
MAVHDEMRTLFREEVMENLAELDGALLELEHNPRDMDTVNRIFRAVHTIKGACDMFGLAAVVRLAHDLESLFDQVRTGWRVVGKGLLDASFAAKDRFAAMLAEGGESVGEDVELDARLKELLKSPDLPEDEAPARPCAAPEPDVPAATPPAPSAPSGSTRTWRIRLAPSDAGHLAKSDPLALLDELRSMGKLSVRCDLSAVPELAVLDPLDCDLRFEALLRGDDAAVVDANALRDVFCFLENPGDVTIESCEGCVLETPVGAPPAPPAAPQAPEPPAAP